METALDSVTFLKKLKIIQNKARLSQLYHLMSRTFSPAVVSQSLEKKPVILTIEESKGCLGHNLLDPFSLDSMQGVKEAYVNSHFRDVSSSYSC